VLTIYVKVNIFLCVRLKNFKLFINTLLSTGGAAKKHVFGREGKVAGIGSHTLAYVRWHFPIFFYVFMQQKFHCHSAVSRKVIFLSVNALIEIDSRFIFREDKFQHQEHSFDFQFIVKGGSI